MAAGEKKLKKKERASNRYGRMDLQKNNKPAAYQCQHRPDESSQVPWITLGTRKLSSHQLQPWFCATLQCCYVTAAVPAAIELPISTLGMQRRGGGSRMDAEQSWEKEEEAETSVTSTSLSLGWEKSPLEPYRML